MVASLIDIAFDDISSRFHRVELDRARAFWSRAATSPDEIHALNEVHRREFLSFLAGVSGPLHRRMSAGWTAGVRPETTTRDEIIALRSKTLPLDSAVFLRYAETTSGSAGRPFRVRRTSHSFQRELLRVRWALRYYAHFIGAPPANTLLYLSHYPGALSHLHVDRLDDELRIVKFAVSAETVQEVMLRIREYTLDRFVLSATPSTLQWILSSGAMLPRTPQYILAAGESYPGELKSQAVSGFGCPVFEQYVMREVGLVGTQCVLDAGLHLFSTDIEVVSCKQQLWLTDLTNRIDLYVNYLTGDFGEVGTVNPCRCGMAWPLLREFQGREFGKPMSTATVRG